MVGGRAMKRIRCEISSDHGVDIFDLPSVPREGDFIRVASSQYTEGRTPEQGEQEARDGRHSHDMVERVRYVLWDLSEDALVVTIDTDCVVAPA